MRSRRISVRSWGTTLADQAGMPERPIEKRCAELLCWIEERSEPVLIVLDNVASWRSDERPQPLPSGPHVHVLVTTRVRNLGGAQLRHMDLGTLAPPHDRALLLSLAERDPEPGVAELLAHMDGHALGLELAGAFLRTYSGETAESYLNALHQSAECVEREVVDRVRYERTTGQALHAMWERLPASTRDAWRLAAVFEPDPATRELAASVGLDRQALRALDALHVVRAASEERWSMHRLTRAFGLQQGDAAELAAAKRAFVQGCHALLHTQSLDRSRGFRLYTQDRAHFDAALRIGAEIWGEDSKPLMELRAQVGSALYFAGDLARSSALLEQAVAFCEASLSESFRAHAPLDWAALQHTLGSVLRVLGRHQGKVQRLEQAERAFRAALEVRTRERAPLDWAATLSALGGVLRVLGQRSRGVECLEEAVAAFRGSLQERTRTPLDWAATQLHLGGALQSLGEREAGTARIEEAIEAYRLALGVYTRERVPLEWAETQCELGNALVKLGDRESGTQRFEAAVQAFEVALEELPRERVPLLWATVQNSLANALCALGEREQGAQRLQEGVSAYRAVLQEWTRERVPLEWALTQNNIGNALVRIALRDRQREPLEAAVCACRAALQERTRERMPREWALTQNNLGNALEALGRLEQGTARLEESVCAYRAALGELSREREPVDWAASHFYLANVLSELADREPGTQRLQDAVECYTAALEECRVEQLPTAWAVTQAGLAGALWKLAERERSTPRLEQVAAALSRARDVWKSANVAWRVQRLDRYLCEIERQIASRTPDASAIDRLRE